jgi:hypothetical protein
MCLPSIGVFLAPWLNALSKSVTIIIIIIVIIIIIIIIIIIAAATTINLKM